MGEGWGWGDNRTLSGENQVRSTCARPTFPHPCRGSSRQTRSRQQGAAVGYFRSRLLLALPREPRTLVQAAVELGLDVLTVWEGETRDGAKLEEVLTSFFGRP